MWRFGCWLLAIRRLVSTWVIDALNVASSIVSFSFARIPIARWTTTGWAQWIAGAFRSAVTISDVSFALAGACWWRRGSAWWALRIAVAFRSAVAISDVSFALSGALGRRWLARWTRCSRVLASWVAWVPLALSAAGYFWRIQGHYNA